jgi:folate-binding protein YgfZ
VPERYWVRLDRDVLTADGPEATAYLQGQLSQDITELGEGGHAWSWLLAPSGKVDALLRVWRRGADEWAIDTDRGWGEAALTRLNRFKLRTKVAISMATASVIGLRGEGWNLPGDGSVLVAAPPWPGVTGADVLDLTATQSALDAITATQTPMTTEDYEAERIVVGIPRMGAELGEKTIPAETGLVSLTVSFTKGCYTGQELVARIDSRGGNVPRHLRGLRLADGVDAGAEVLDGDSVIGALTSVARSERFGWVGLGYIKRGYEPPHGVEVGVDRVAAEVVALPRPG